ncbi:hypothetical protein PMI09_00351 [Rhizobium sp. CF122]|nr:hypothetical protein PMI09_00351 [Rhizobium sp. CF122]
MSFDFSVVRLEGMDALMFAPVEQEANNVRARVDYAGSACQISRRPVSAGLVLATAAATALNLRRRDGGMRGHTSRRALLLLFSHFGSRLIDKSRDLTRL